MTAARTPTTQTRLARRNRAAVRAALRAVRAFVSSRSKCPQCRELHHTLTAAGFTEAEFETGRPAPVVPIEGGGE